VKNQLIPTLRKIDEYMLVCDSCKLKFILTAVIIRKREDEDDIIELMPQERVHYCPYCGTRPAPFTDKEIEVSKRACMDTIIAMSD